MSVIVDQAQFKVEQAELALDAARTDLERAQTLQADPDRTLAEAIRDAYYDDDLLRSLGDSRNPDQWLRMARAARGHLGPKSGPRVFVRGDVIPADVKKLKTAVDAVVLRASADGFNYCGETEGKSVWGVNDTTKGGWEDYEFPLTEIADEAVEVSAAKREPRVFRRGDVIPADVVELVDASGSTLVRGSAEGFGWPIEGRNSRFDWGKNDTSDSLWTGEPFPLTEVLQRDPRKFTREDQEPTDVKYLRDWEGDLFRYVSPDHWEYRQKDTGKWSDMRFRWREVTTNTGATEDLEYTE